MLILCNFDAFYHSFMKFLHWHVILLKSTFLHYLRLIMCFIDVWHFLRSKNWKWTIFFGFILSLVDDLKKKLEKENDGWIKVNFEGLT